jgi:hypothetical protein
MLIVVPSATGVPHSRQKKRVKAGRRRATLPTSLPSQPLPNMSSSLVMRYMLAWATSVSPAYTVG